MPVTPGIIPVTPGTGKNLDTAELVVGGNTVEREIVTIGDGATPGNYAAVTADGALKISTKGTQTPAAPTAATVDVISGSILAANPNRTGVVLINTSGNFISLAFGTAAVLYSGITLNPSGGTFEMDDNTFSLSEIFAIASGASSNLAIQELS